MHANIPAPDPFCIAGTTIGSRLLLGTAGYPNQRTLRAAVEASGAEIVTVSIRRVSLKGHGSDTIGLLAGRRFLPNTAGCETAQLDLPDPKGFAIALNGEVVRRDAWAATALNDGDRVEIIRAMSGG